MSILRGIPARLIICLSFCNISSGRRESVVTFMKGGFWVEEGTDAKRLWTMLCSIPLIYG